MLSLRSFGSKLGFVPILAALTVLLSIGFGQRAVQADTGENPRKGEDTCRPHTADQSGSYSINLSELLRVIQFFNSGGYHCSPTGEDGFDPGDGVRDCTPHDSDYNPQNWIIGLSELLRLIQLFNVGAYSPCPDLGTEDGFCQVTAPITLNGPASMTAECGDVFLDPGATLALSCPGAPVPDVAVTPPADLVAPLQVGTYSIVYSDPGNPDVSVTRTLEVVDTQAPAVDFPAAPIHFRGTVFQDMVVDDGCDGAPVLSVDYENIDGGGTPRVRVTATDAAGNTTESPWQEVEVRRPNILDINIDDLNDWVTFMQAFNNEGNPEYVPLTPHLDRLAEQSRVFRHAYAPVPISNPSRAAILTGRHPINSGLYWRGRWFRFHTEIVGATNEEVLARYLANEGGYRTYGAGKVGFDGGINDKLWQEWLFGNDMSQPAAEEDDRYFRRPVEPVMMDAVTLPTVENMGLQPWWGVYHLAVAAHAAGEPVNPVEQTVVRLKPDASAGSPGIYEIDLRNVSGVNTYDWSLCIVTSRSPLRFCEVTPATSGGSFTVSHDHGSIAPAPAADRYDPAPHDTVTVSVVENTPFELAVVAGNNGTAPNCPCEDDVAPADPFNPVFVPFEGLSLEWVGPLLPGATSRDLRVWNNTGTLGFGLSLHIVAEFSDVRIAGQAGSHTLPLLASGGSTTVTVSWGQGGGNPPNRWHDYDSEAVAFPLNMTNRFPNFAIDLRSDGANRARIWNEFKEEPPVPGQGIEISDALIANKVIEWLGPDALGDADADEPFYLAAGIYRPHLPHFVPEEYFTRVQQAGYPAYWDNRPLSGPGPEPFPSPWGHALSMTNWLVRPLEAVNQLGEYRDAYLATVAYADDQLGRMLEAVDSNEYLRRSTIVILWSDHGYHLGEMSHLMKSSLWERGTLVPLLVRIPGSYQSSASDDGTFRATLEDLPVGYGDDATIDVPVGLVDLYPTIIDLAGVPRPAFLDAQRDKTPEPESGRGISLKPLLFNETDLRTDQPGATASEPVVSSFVRMPCGFPSDTTLDCFGPGEGVDDIRTHAVRDGDYRYIRYNRDFDDTDNSGNELYDLFVDPFELSNIIGAASTALLDALHAPVGKPDLGSIWTAWSNAFTNVMSALAANPTAYAEIPWQAGWGAGGAAEPIAVNVQVAPGETFFALQGTVHFDSSDFVLDGMRLPQALANQGYQLSFYDQGGRDESLGIYNFRISNGIFNTAMEGTVLILDVRCIAANCTNRNVEIMSNVLTFMSGAGSGKAHAWLVDDAVPGAPVPLEPFVYEAPEGD